MAEKDKVPTEMVDTLTDEERAKELKRARIFAKKAFGTITAWITYEDPKTGEWVTKEKIETEDE